MAGRYSPIYSGVWNDDALEGATFECKGFFVFLFSNHRVRPSGIYRVTDAQLGADTGLPTLRLRRYLRELIGRERILRDGHWLFVRGYLARQPKQENLLGGVRRDISECTSASILEAFSKKYPLYSQWSADRRATIGRPLADDPLYRAEQSRAVTEQSRAEQSREPSDDLSITGSGLGSEEYTPTVTPLPGETRAQTLARDPAHLARYAASLRARKAKP